MTSDRVWVDLVDAYLAALRRKGRAPTSVRAYRFGLEHFARTLPLPRGSNSVRLIGRGQLAGWQDLTIDLGWAPRTRQLATGAVRNALQWASQNGWPVEPAVWVALEQVHAPRLLPKPIPPPQLERLIAYLAPRRPRMAPRDLRDRALFFYLLSTGARISEALSVDRDDLAADAVVVVRQKGGTQKLLIATESATETIADYLRARDDPHPALFVTHRNPPTRRLTAAAVREEWHALAAKVGVPPFHSHQLRHTCATELMDAQVSPEVIAAHLGHHGLASLAGYAELRTARRREAVDALEARLQLRRDPGRNVVAIKGGRGRRVDFY